MIERDTRHRGASHGTERASAEPVPGKRTLVESAGTGLPFLQLGGAADYNRAHGELVARFRAAQGDLRSGANGELDPEEVARWQGAHGLDPDGRVGPHTVEAAIAAHPPVDDHHPLPEVAHGDGNAPEKPRAGKALYAAGGALSKEHLHQYGLTEDEFAFKQRVYDAAVARLGDKIHGGVAAEDLAGVEGGQRVRTEVAGPLASMLSAMRAALQAGEPAGGVEVGSATDIHVTSGYRSPERDRDLWDSYFQRYLGNTVKEREATGDPLGAAAVKVLVQYIGLRKAPPGGSNHSNGIAVDLQIEQHGHRVPNNYDDQKKWRASWQYAWLKANAATYGFRNYPKEAWHWDHKA